MARITMKQVKIWIAKAKNQDACRIHLSKLNAIKTVKELRRHEQVPFWGYWYARYVIKGRWLEAEPYIMKDPLWSIGYAEGVIKGRWLEAEPYIKENAFWWSEYKKQFSIEEE